MNRKTSSDKKCEAVALDYLVPSRITAEIVGTSINNVNKVRRGARGKMDGGKAASIKYVDSRLYEEIGITVRRLKATLQPMD